jgi:hypothetical protein
MADQFERLNVLVNALVEALGEDLAPATLISDLGLKGAEGKAIQRSLRLTGNLYRDCRNLLLACREYPNAINDLHEILSHYLHLKLAWDPLQAALQPFLPTDRPVAAAASPPVGQSVYISYAWGDSTPEGQRRGQLVDDLCQALSASGISVLIDREQVKPGERISAFMDAISKGDMIIVVLSDRYLESEFCMYEINGIWRQSNEDEHLFLSRVIPLILPDAKLKTTADLLARGEYWLSIKRDLDRKVGGSLDSVGSRLFARYKLIKQFAEHVSDLLLLLVDKQEPRDFERQAQEGFREVVAQILAARSA